MDRVEIGEWCELWLGETLSVMPTLPAASFDAVITDPPYPCIDRSYGYWTEEEWWALMRPVVAETRRLLKPSGSAVFILQPNSERVGRMRPWLWDFMAWVCREWNMVQDVWWWNPNCLPAGGSNARGLMRATVKSCVWAGNSDCIRNQESVLWEPNWDRILHHAARRATYRSPCGYGVNEGRIADTTLRRGGSTPFNLLPIQNANSSTSAGANGHGAGTPLPLAEWWVRYITPPGGRVLDPFSGTATTGVACRRLKRTYVGIERIRDYHATAVERCGGNDEDPPLFAEAARHEPTDLFAEGT